MKYLGPNADLDSEPWLEVDLDDGVLTIALNRPQQRNAINAALALALERLLMAVRGDEAVRVVMLRGNGPDFCVGLETAGTSDLAASIGQMLHQLAQPVIARVHGQCHGVSIVLVESCDIVIAADDADLDLGDKGAQRDDIITLSVPASELDAQTRQLARELADKDALALRFTKETLQRVGDLAWDEVLNFTSTKQAELKALQAGRPSARAQAVESFLAGKTKPGAGG